LGLAAACARQSYEFRPILFTSDQDGKEELFVMNPDGSNVRRLTVTPGSGAFGTPQYTYSSFGAWSPDASRIAFTSNRPWPGDPDNLSRRTDIYLMNADGTELQRLTDHEAADLDPDFSPDGEHLVFTSTRDGNAELYRMRTDGSDLTRLTWSAGRDAFGDWHPDGTRILFESRDRDGRSGLFVMSAEGGEVRHLVSGMRGSWSPDGHRIAFGARDCWIGDVDGQFDSIPLPWSAVETRCAETEDTEFGLFILDSRSKQIDRVLPLDPAGAEVGSPDGTSVSLVHGAVEPQWSPDGSQLVFHYGRRGPDTAHIDKCCKDVEVFRVNVDGTDLVALTWNTIFDGHMRWY
jgi:Tol biopolymer transport system component